MSECVLSGALPGFDVVYDPWTAVADVAQRRVGVVEGRRRAVVILHMVGQQVGHTERKIHRESGDRSQQHRTADQNKTEIRRKSKKSRAWVQETTCSQTGAQINQTQTNLHRYLTPEFNTNTLSFSSSLPLRHVTCALKHIVIS